MKFDPALSNYLSDKISYEEMSKLVIDLDIYYEVFLVNIPNHKFDENVTIKHLIDRYKYGCLFILPRSNDNGLRYLFYVRKSSKYIRKLIKLRAFI